jgi:hypothetical protein
VARTLDPSLLDAIVAELDLADLATLDRALFAMRLFLDDVEAWLRRLANDEDSWLNRLAELLGAGPEFADGVSFLDVLMLAIPLLVIATALSATAIFIWRHRSRGPRADADVPAFTGMTRACAEVAIEALPAREQPAALFRRACSELANSGALRLEKSLTNSAIARAARVSGKPRRALQQLANAADRALFGGWLPADADLQQLRGDYRELFDGPDFPT